MANDFEELSGLLEQRENKIEEEKKKKDEHYTAFKERAAKFRRFAKDVIEPAFKEVGEFLESQGHHYKIEQKGLYGEDGGGFTYVHGVTLEVSLKEKNDSDVFWFNAPVLEISSNSDNGVSTKRVKITGNDRDSSSQFKRTFEEEKPVKLDELTKESIKQMAIDFV